MLKDAHEIWRIAMAKKRAPAEKQAAAMIEAGRFDDAESAVRAVDQSVYADVAIGKLFRERLVAIVNDPASSHADREAVFRRALAWIWKVYPDPHTEIEADRYQEGMARDRRELVSILGYDPGA